MKNDHFFSAFNRSGLFSKVFGHVKDWLMLELHIRIRVSHVVCCPIVFNSLYEQSWQGGVFFESIYEKLLFFSAFSCLGLFP